MFCANANTALNITIALRSDGTVKRLFGRRASEHLRESGREGGIRYRQSYVDRWIDELAPRSLARSLRQQHTPLSISCAATASHPCAIRRGRAHMRDVRVRRAYGRHAWRANLVSTSNFNLKPNRIEAARMEYSTFFEFHLERFIWGESVQIP